MLAAIRQYLYRRVLAQWRRRMYPELLHMSARCPQQALGPHRKDTVYMYAHLAARHGARRNMHHSEQEEVALLHTIRELNYRK